MTRDEDLAGFWDMVSIQVEDIKKMFENLSDLRKVGWKLEPKIIATKKQSIVNAEKKQTKTSVTTTSVDKPLNGLKQTTASKARAEAAKQRLLEAKKNAALMKQKESEDAAEK